MTAAVDQLLNSNAYKLDYTGAPSQVAKSITYQNGVATPNMADTQKTFEERRANSRTGVDALDAVYGVVNAQSQLMALLGLDKDGQAGAIAALEQTPGYQFRVQQAQKALQSTFNKGGLGLSGNFATALNTQIQGLAQQGYQSTVDNLTKYLGQEVEAPVSGSQGYSTGESTGMASGSTSSSMSKGGTTLGAKYYQLMQNIGADAQKLKNLKANPTNNFALF